MFLCLPSHPSDQDSPLWGVRMPLWCLDSLCQGASQIVSEGQTSFTLKALEMLKLLFTQKKIWQVDAGAKLLCQFSFFSFFRRWLVGWLVGWYDENLTVVHNSLGCCDAAGRRPQGELGEGGARGFEWRESRPHNALLWPHSPSDNQVWVISTFNCLIWRKNCHGSWHQIKGVLHQILTSFTPHFSLN